MNKQKPTRKRLCECGKKFKTSVKFGNETMCDACYEARHAEFNAWFRSLTNEEQREALAWLRQRAAELGITEDMTEEELEQERIDDIAASLLADVEINL